MNFITYDGFLNFLVWLDYGYTKRKNEALNIIVNSMDVVNLRDKMKPDDKAILKELFLNN